MTNLSKLKVSLTKHGASKIADILKEFDSQEVLDHIDGNFKSIDINRAQAKKNLSIKNDGSVPVIWEKVKDLGNEFVDKLVFISIVFSHYKLIETMRQGSTNKLTGVVERGKVIDGKEFTNFVFILRHLGFETESKWGWIKYNLSSLVDNLEFVPLVREILKIKLREAGWREENDLIEESLRLNFHEVFSLAPSEFSSWLSEEEIVKQIEEEAEEEPKINQFNFEAGYSKRDVDSYKTKVSESEQEINPAHNIIQKKLYKYLSEKFGEKNVGTEIDSGIGTLIDVVLKDQRNKYIFFEIKTSKNVRTAIRDALPQLLEYSYWPSEERAEKLIIVTIKDITVQAVRYLENLRSRFNIPIYYAKFDLNKETLSDEF